MKSKEIMFIAGEASGDLLAAELVEALREELIATEISYSPDFQPTGTGLEPRFFGAGGPRMKAAGVELAFDMTEHSLIGLSDALKQYFKFRRLFRQLLNLALTRLPDVIICVDFAGFNRRFAQAVKQRVRSRRDWFHTWNPRLVQYVSPQVWASRESRARQIERDFDLLLTIFPFEKAWYASRTPRLRVEFVGHPMVERFQRAGILASRNNPATNEAPRILLLPGSREKELLRHLPVMLGAVKLIRRQLPRTSASVVLPNDSLRQLARTLGADLEVQVGDLDQFLSQTDLAISKTGTVTMECALFGVPAVTLYKTSKTNYEIARRLVKVKSLTMPNLLAGEQVFPEFIQDDATAENIAHAALDLLRNETGREQIQARLRQIVSSLGGPGATRRAAAAVASLL